MWRLSVVCAINESDCFILPSFFSSRHKKLTNFFLTISLLYSPLVCPTLSYNSYRLELLLSVSWLTSIQIQSTEYRISQHHGGTGPSIPGPYGPTFGRLDGSQYLYSGMCWIALQFSIAVPFSWKRVPANKSRLILLYPILSFSLKSMPLSPDAENQNISCGESRLAKPIF